MTLVSLLVQRELRLRAQIWTTFALRVGAAIFGTVLCVQQLLASGRTPAAVGRSVFDALMAATFVLSCSASILSASVIQTERREGTLGLLLLTKVNSFDVIVGKLASSGLTSLYGVVAVLPALMLPLLAGGVTWSETMRKGVALIATLWFALAAGLCGGTAQNSRSKPFGAALVLTILFVLVPFMGFTLPGHGLLRYASLISPLTLLVTAGDSLFGTAPKLYWISLLLVFVLGSLFLFVAARLLGRAVRRDHGMTRERSPKIDQERKRAIGMGRWRPDKSDSEPLEWLIYRDGIGAGIWLLAVLTMVVSRLTAMMMQVSGVKMAGALLFAAFPFGLGAAAAGGCLIATVATRFFASARGRSHLELLLTTPVGAKSIVTEQWIVLKRVFLWPIIVLELAFLFPLWGITGGAAELSPYFLLLMALNLVNTALGIAALCWLGMRFAIKSSSQTRAILSTVVVAQGLPWLVYLSIGMFPLVPDIILAIFYAALLASTNERLGESLNADCRIWLPVWGARRSNLL